MNLYLMEKARSELVKFCRKAGIELNETYKKMFKKSMIKLWKYKKDSQSEARKRLLKKLKIRLGRLIRTCERGMEKSGVSDSATSLIGIKIISKAKSIFDQSCLSKKEKDLIKKKIKSFIVFMLQKSSA